MKLLELSKNTWLFIRFVSLVGFSSHSTFLYATNLSQVVEIALEQNLGLQSASIQLKTAEKDTNINLAKFLPSVSMSANTTWNENESHKSSKNTRKEYNSNGYNISLSQSLFNLNDIYSQKTSRLDLNIQELQLEKTVQQTILDVASTYFEILKNNAQIRATQAELNSTNSQFNQIKRNVELGNVAGSEMYEVMAQKEQVANDLRTLNKDKRVLIKELETLVQFPVRVNYDLISTAKLLTLPDETIEQLFDLTNNQNLDIQIAKRQVSKNVNLLRESGSKFLPSLSTSISYSYNDTNDVTDADDLGISEQVVYSLNLDIPIISGGRNIYGYQKSQLELTKAEIDFNDQYEKNQQLFHETISDINDSADSLVSFQAILKANYASYRGIQKAYKLGTRTVTDLLAAESKLFNSIRDYENTRYSYLTQTLKLEQISGRLNLSTIDKISALMEKMDSENAQSPIPYHLLDVGGVK
jgi:outer membrane protein TolC